MAEDINKHLLSQFYGLKENSGPLRFISSSKGIESFENARDAEGLSTEQLQSFEETGKNQKYEEESDQIYNESKEGNLPRSPHILTVEELLEDNFSDSQENNFEIDNIIGDIKDDKSIPTKNFTRLEDTFTKAMAKISETSIQGETNTDDTSTNLPFNPVTKAKKLWRQKTMVSKESVLTSLDVLSRFNGIYLNLNNSGICEFPLDVLPKLTNLQILYLDSNYLKEIPNEFFTILRKLKWLDLRNNQLSTIPTTIKGHTSLETLLLQGNNIQILPLEIGLALNLRNLQVAHNPIIFPPKEILDLDCPKIINFLRSQWNERHPNEIIQLKELHDDKIKKKPSTIICYQSPTRRTTYRKNLLRSLQSTPNTSVRLRTWSYKPGNRCEGNGNEKYQQQLLWMATAKKLLREEAEILQKAIDKKMLDNWRHKYRNFKFNNKITIPKNYSLEPPFALHVENSEIKNNQMKVKRAKSKTPYVNSRNFIDSFKDFVDSVKKLDDETTAGNMTPSTEQKKLQTEIDKIYELQKKLQELKSYNDCMLSSYTGRDRIPRKEFIRPPSIIL